MGLDNSLEVVVYHLLLGRMVGLSHQDGFFMVSALVCMVIHWIRPTRTHDIRLSSHHNFTKLFHCVVS